MRALLYVQHLLGSGHLKRTALIAEELSSLGAEVHLVSGGMPVGVVETGSFKLHQLEPMRTTDATFSTLVDASGDPVNESLFARREAALLEISRDIKPNVALIESWPFGRRKLRGELLALCASLHEQQPRPLIACSIRDILQRGRKPKRVAETAELVARWFDHVLVHSDPEFATLDQSFPRTSEIEQQIVYTGFVSRPGRSMPAWRGNKAGEVLVSAGGGAAGAQLYDLCLAAANIVGEDVRWRLLLGEALASDVTHRLRASAPAWVTVEPARPDFPKLLSECGLSISQAGYNTTMDLVGCGCPALVVPFVEHGETEQLDRAQRLHHLGIAHAVSSSGISPRQLATLVEQHRGKLPGARHRFRTDGSAWTARWLLDHADSAKMA